jgi:hypothetical protein
LVFGGVYLVKKKSKYEKGLLHLILDFLPDLGLLQKLIISL